MQNLAIEVLDHDLREAFKADPGPVALQAALQIQMIRCIRVLQPKPEPKPINLVGPNPAGHKKGKGH